jgi:hypothetical protein
MDVGLLFGVDAGDASRSENLSDSLSLFPLH